MGKVFSNSFGFGALHLGVRPSGLGIKPDVDPELISPLPLMGILAGIPILRPLTGEGLLIMGLHLARIGLRA